MRKWTGPSLLPRDRKMAVSISFRDVSVGGVGSVLCAGREVFQLATFDRQGQSRELCSTVSLQGETLQLTTCESCFFLSLFSIG